MDQMSKAIMTQLDRDVELCKPMIYEFSDILDECIGYYTDYYLPRLPRSVGTRH
jgi:hypothetical protein